MNKKNIEKKTCSLNELCHFINNKSIIINQKIQDQGKLALKNTDQDPKNKSMLCLIQQVLTYSELNRLKMELDILKDISMALVELMKSGDRNPDKKILKAFLIDNIHNSEAFTTSHPFYGYEPYHEMLFNHYKSREDYETCAQIKRIIDSGKN